MNEKECECSGGWPQAVAYLGFFLLIAVGFASCGGAFDKPKPPIPKLECPDGFAPKYYESMSTRKLDCIKVK